MFPRREFIHRATVAAALFGIPLARAEQFFSEQSAPLPPRALLATDPRRYWSDLRRQWLLAPDRINLNCGSVGCVPMPVLRATIDHILYAEAANHISGAVEFSVWRKARRRSWVRIGEAVAGEFLAGSSHVGCVGR